MSFNPNPNQAKKRTREEKATAEATAQVRKQRYVLTLTPTQTQTQTLTPTPTLPLTRCARSATCAWAWTRSGTPSKHAPRARAAPATTEPEPSPRPWLRAEAGRPGTRVLAASGVRRPASVRSFVTVCRRAAMCRCVVTARLRVSFMSSGTVLTALRMTNLVKVCTVYVTHSSKPYLWFGQHLSLSLGRQTANAHETCKTSRSAQVPNAWTRRSGLGSRRRPGTVGPGRRTASTGTV